jgi:hypothetical protein
VYSVGVLLWEISSGRPPFESELYDTNLINKILQGYRETIVLDTSTNYSNLYIGKNDSFNIIIYCIVLFKY